MRQLKNFSARMQENKSDRDFANEAINKYGGMKEDELIEALIANVSKSKEEGTYDPEKMDAFIRTVSPFISAQQRERLANVIKLIDNSDI